MLKKLGLLCKQLMQIPQWLDINHYPWRVQPEWSLKLEVRLKIKQNSDPRANAVFLTVLIAHINNLFYCLYNYFRFININHMATTFGYYLLTFF